MVPILMQQGHSPSTKISRKGKREEEGRSLLAAVTAACCLLSIPFSQAIVRTQNAGRAWPSVQTI